MRTYFNWWFVCATTHLHVNLINYQTWLINQLIHHNGSIRFWPINMLRHSFPIVFMDLTIDWMSFTESNCLSKMSKLAHLNLHLNYFDKGILRFLGTLPILKYVDLSNNYMEGPLSSHGTCKFKSSSSRILWKNLETNWDFITNFTFIEIYFLHVKNHKMLDICKWLW